MLDKVVHNSAIVRPEELVYKKEKGRYKLVGREFTGRLSDGLWLIQNGGCSMSCICNLAAVREKNTALDIGALMLHKDKACIALSNLKKKKAYSNMDEVETIINVLLEMQGTD